MTDNLFPISHHTENGRQHTGSENGFRCQDQVPDPVRAVHKRLNAEIIRSGISSEHKSHLADRLVDRIRELEGICHIRSSGSCR